MAPFDYQVSLFTEHFYELIQPENPLVQEVARHLVSHVRESDPVSVLLTALLGEVSGRFEYDLDINIWGAEDYWAPPDELMHSDRADCDDMCLLASSVLYALGVPHFLVIGFYNGSGHTWIEVQDEENEYLLEFTVPALYIIPKGASEEPYRSVEKLLVT